MSDTMTASKGRVSMAPAQKRRVMETSSGFSSSTETVRGSSAIPQMGQEPGASRTISGCMGQVYSGREAGASMVAGSSAMPHLGQLPGPALCTSGCMGQVWSALDCGFAVSWIKGVAGVGFAVNWIKGAAAGLGWRYLGGSAWNLVTQPWQQK